MISCAIASRLALFAALAFSPVAFAPNAAHAQAGRDRALPPRPEEEQLAAERDKLTWLMQQAALFRAQGSKGLPDAERAAADQVVRVYEVLIKLLQATASEGVVDTVRGLRQLQDARLVNLLKEAEVARLALEKYENDLAALNARLAESESRNALPPLEEADIKVFSLRHVNAVQAAQTIDSLLGPGPVRVAVDERTNSLIVAGKSESLTVIEALLLRLDAQAAQSAEKTAAAADGRRAGDGRSLLLRIFWLADGLSEQEGQDPAEFLPTSVVKALGRVGLNNPRLVTQTVNSLAHGEHSSAVFNSSVPVVLRSMPVQLSCEGSLEWLGPEQVRLKVGINLPMLEIDVNGSLVTPLGHYTVLGTANSVMADAATRQAMEAEERRRAERRQRESGRGGYGGGYGGGGAAEDPAPSTAPQYNTSHFAFVVQVIEGESFPAEE